MNMWTVMLLLFMYRISGAEWHQWKKRS